MAPALPASASKPVVRYECFGKTGRLTKPNRRGVIRGTPRNDLIIVLRRDVVVLAGGGNDRVCTGGGDDFVSGASGHDLISSGRGRDTLNGGEGQDYLNGGAGNDRLQGGHGHSDTLVGASGDDRLFGGDDHSGGDHIFGGQGADHLVGGNGVADGDFLVGGEGTDVIDGGSGFDTASFAFSEVGVQVDLAAGTSSVDSLTGIENVDGSDLGDLITGDPLANRFDGNYGDDVIAGGLGDDHIDGGAGQDSLDGGDGIDLVSFLSSPRGVAADLETGTATGESSDTFTMFENLLGSAYDDELAGDAGPNDLFGSSGNNAVFGRDGDDELYSATTGDAGAGEDFCLDSASVENCEQQLHGDPPAYSTITGPGHASSVEPARFREITGTASPGAFGPRPQKVQVSLRRLSGSGCYWWDVRHAVMRPGHCDRPLWAKAFLDRDGARWSRRVPHAIQLLNPGRYQIRSRIRQPGYTERGSSTTRNLVEFRLR
jgi:Ca2+-binding RTX toxin-like protein